MKKIMSTLLVGAGLALSACTPLATLPDSPSPVPSTPVPSTPRAVVQTTSAAPVSSEAQARQQVASHLREGRYQAALAVIEKERRTSGSSRLLEEEQLQVLRELSSAGEESFQAGDYEHSGRTLRLLLNNYPQGKTAAERLGISRQDLNDRLELCAERLMAQGLANYRAANLSAAIETWKKILSFHSAHDGARKGIQTAETQLKNLRALP